MSKIIEDVDVICQYKPDGSILPLRLRFMNDEGEYETYTIKGFRKSECKGARTTADGIFVADSTLIFECMIFCLNMKRVVRLYFNPKNASKWLLAI